MHAGHHSLRGAGCDGLPAEAMLFKGKLGRYTSHSIKTSMENDVLSLLYGSAEDITKFKRCDIC